LLTALAKNVGAGGQWGNDVTAGLIILGFFLFALVLESHRRNVASRRPAPVDHDRDLRDLRDCYAAGEITLEQFEAQVEDVLENESRARTSGLEPPTTYSERWEIHIHDAPPGRSLHIHLP
jgi:hypothetical protein